MTDAPEKNLLFISMLGEKEQFDPDHFTSLCPSGLEKDWVAEWFAPMAREIGFAMSSIDICRGDALPQPSGVDCVILGGTMHVINEDRPWLHKLFDWLDRYRPLERPLLAICGGHQLISTRFEDGKLAGRAGGTLAGTYEVELTEAGRSHPLFAGLSERPRFNFANYLHVVPSITQQERVLAQKGESTAICIDHGGRWYTTQFHPESTRSVWACMYERKEPENVANYSDRQDGPALIGNFLRMAAGAAMAETESPSAAGSL